MPTPRSFRYLGLDLAWAPRNSSGGAVLEVTPDGGVVVQSTVSLRAHEDILSWIARSRGRAGAIVAVNAPVIVENSSGRRPCDALLQQHFGQHHLDEYQVNTVNATHPRTMGRALMRMGFNPNPSSDGDRLVETCNQAAQILLFELDRPIRMKVGPVGARKEAVTRFREALSNMLGDAEPPLLPSGAFDTLLHADLGASNGSRVGELEEQLEAVLTAYTAAYLHLRGPESCAFLGDMRDGYILVPTTRYPEGAEESDQAGA